MSICTPRSSKRMGDDLIDETPACTPIPQASSTATHRPSDSPEPHEIMESKEVKEVTYLDGDIDGLKTFSDMLHGKNEIESVTDSSLGILKVDDLQGLCENELSHGEFEMLKLDQRELSDLAVDMRLRLQKELAQRTLDRFSLSSGDSNIENIVIEDKKPEKPCSDLKENLFTSNHEIDSVSEFGVDSSESSSFLESFHNPFDDVNLDSNAVANMAAIMVEFSGDEFIPGEKCEDRLLADESAWKKENIPPTLGPINPSTFNLDFSGILGNAEISVIATSPSKQQQKRKMSVGEFFRLKSNLSSSFGLQGKDQKKNWNLGTVMEKETDGLNSSSSVTQDKNQKESWNFEALTEPGTISNANEGSRYSRLSDSRNLSVSSERNSSTRDSLSLSSIAKVLSDVDTCGSPHTVVKNILKQCGLYKSDCTKDESISYSPLSNTSRSTDRILKDNSNIEQLAASHRKLLTNSYSNVPLIPFYNKNMSCASKEANFSNDVSSSESVTAVSEVRTNDSLHEVSRRIDFKNDVTIGSRALEEICSSKFNNPETFKTIIREKNDLLSVKKDFDNEISTSNKVDELCAIEDSIASGDLSVLKFDDVDRKVDEGVWNLIQKLSDMPRESVDCSALIPALKEKCPWVLSHDDDQKNNRTGDNSSLDWIKMKYNTSVLSELSESSVCKVPEDSVTAPHSGLWISIGAPSHESHICLGVPLDISLPIHNVTERWILCGLEMLSLQLEGQETNDSDQSAIIQLPSKKVLMDPNCFKEAKVKVLPLCEGKLEISIKIQLCDVVTKSEQSVTTSIVAFVEEPQLKITGGAESHSDLDFGILPEECAKVMTLTIANSGSSSVPLKLRVLNEGLVKLSSFALVSPCSEIVQELDMTLRPADSVNAHIMFAAPPLRLLTGKKGFVQLRGVLCMELVAVIPVELENINLAGCVGMTSLEVYQPAIPVKLVVSEVGKTVTSLLPLKNHGLVPLTITPVILPVDADGVILAVEPREIEVKPGTQETLKVSLTATKHWTGSVTSALQITRQPLGPKFYVDVIGEFVNEKKQLKQDRVRRKLEDANILTSSTTKHVSGKESRKSKQSPTSGRSSSSSSTKSSLGEKLNIRTTHREMTWGTVDIGKSVSKTFDVRSEELFNIPAHVYVEDKEDAFKLMDGDGKAVLERSVTLRPMKNYTFTVVFRPQKIGPVSAKLIFVVRELRLILPLYGYGGNIRLIAKGVPKDGGSRLWLMLYQHPHKTEWESSFCLKNLGNISAFVKIKPISKGFQNVTIQNIVIDPSQLVIQEGGTAKIKVKYQPQHKDLKLLMTSSVQDVVELAALSLISGDEATRLRLKRIHKKQLASNESGISPLLELAPLCEKFIGEGAQGSPNVAMLKDPKESAIDLYSCSVNHQEIILMLENVISGGIDASRAYQSMYHNVVDLSSSKFDDDAGFEWNMVPTCITFHPPKMTSACVQLWTTSLNKHSFEASVKNNPPGFMLVVTPNAGFIPSAGGINLTVTCIPTDNQTPKHQNMWKGSIQICTENDMKELNVCIEYAWTRTPQTHPLEKKKINTGRSSFNNVFKLNEETPRNIFQRNTNKK